MLARDAYEGFLAALQAAEDIRVRDALLAAGGAGIAAIGAIPILGKAVQLTRDGARAGVAVLQAFTRRLRGSPKRIRTTPPASAPSGRKRFQLDNPPYQPARNSPSVINGRSYSGHALDQMQNRGITPSMVERARENGIPSPGKMPKTEQYYDPVNNLSVIINTDTENVVTTRFGR